MDWPENTPDHQIELTLWQCYREAPYKYANLLNPVSEHLLRAIRMLFTNDQVKIHPWLETQAKSWTEEDFSVWFGCAASGKSNSLGLFALLDYITDPNNTFTLLASTSKDMLLLRSFASCTQHLGYLKSNAKMHVPFKYIAQSVSIVPDGLDDEQLLNLKCRLAGKAVQQGTEQEARANLQGVHAKRVRLILDELEGMRSAAMEARHNLASCESFKLIAACNPESWQGLAGKYSTPLGGVLSVNTSTKFWRTAYGTVHRFSAFDSPGLKEPEKYPFLPTQKTIDRIVASNAGNMDAPAVWTFLHALPPPQGTDRTVLTPQMIETYKMSTPATWRGATTKLAALDPAFTSEGDHAVLVTGALGHDIAGNLVLSYDEKPHYLKIEASSQVPVVQQIVEQVREICETEGVELPHIGFDDSGNQSVADAYEMLVGKSGVYRVNFAKSAPDLPVSTTNPQLAKERYKNTATWLYYLMQELGQRGQIRGLPAKAVTQLCTRRLSPKQKPLQIESKKDYKKRSNAESPDEADACAILAGVARERLGLLPGANDLAPGGLVFPTHGHTDMRMVRRFNNLGTTYTSGT